MFDLINQFNIQQEESLIISGKTEKSVCKKKRKDPLAFVVQAIFCYLSEPERCQAALVNKKWYQAYSFSLHQTYEVSCSKMFYSLDTVLSEVAPIFEGMKNHPFVLEMVEGTLPKNKFHFYEQQDALYLSRYGEIFNLVSKLTSDFYEVNFLEEKHVGITSYGKKEVERLFSAGEIVANSESTLYVKYMKRAAKSKKYYWAAGSLMPCLVSYFLIAQNHISQVKPSNPYYEWFKLHFIPDKYQKYASYINYILSKASKVEYEEFVRGFRTSLTLDTIFWHGSYKGGL